MPVGQREDAKWDDAALVARVLDVISGLKKDNKLGKKLQSGRVSYAVEDIEPFKKKLFEKAENEIKELKKSHVKASEIPPADLYSDITYGNMYTKSQSLGKVVLVLPYSAKFRLKDAKKE